MHKNPVIRLLANSWGAHGAAEITHVAAGHLELRLSASVNGAPFRAAAIVAVHGGREAGVTVLNVRVDAPGSAGAYETARAAIGLARWVARQAHACGVVPAGPAVHRFVERFALESATAALASAP